MLRTIRPLLCATLLFSPQVAQAHFAWLATDADGHAVFFFGESIADQTYHLPESLADAAVETWQEGRRSQATMNPVDSDTLVGLASNARIDGPASLTCTAEYGIYHGTKLNYHAQHLLAAADLWPQTPNAELKYQAILTQQADGGVRVQVLLNTKPLSGTKVQLFCADGHEEGSGTTDAQGEVVFSERQVESGLNGLLIAHVDTTVSGEVDGEKFNSESNYLTVTFRKSSKTKNLDVR